MMRGNPKNPTRKQRQLLKAHRKEPDNWWVVGCSPEKLYLQHKQSKKYSTVKRV